MAPSVLLSSELPACLQIESDQDGDGFGYENSQTCIVDGGTSLVPLAGPCVDHNADGYGWNGVETCTTVIQENPTCVDTRPVGDGWGWDGTKSCRTVPGQENAISELETLRGNLLDVSPQGTQHHTVIFCPSTTESYTLKINGELMYHIGTELQSIGMWSSGMFEQDQIINTFIDMQFSIMEIYEKNKIRYNGLMCVFF